MRTVTAHNEFLKDVCHTARSTHFRLAKLTVKRPDKVLEFADFYHRTRGYRRFTLGSSKFEHALKLPVSMPRGSGNSVTWYCNSVGWAQGMPTSQIDPHTPGESQVAGSGGMETCMGCLNPPCMLVFNYLQYTWPSCPPDFYQVRIDSFQGPSRPETASVLTYYSATHIPSVQHLKLQLWPDSQPGGAGSYDPRSVFVNS